MYRTVIKLLAICFIYKIHAIILLLESLVHNVQSFSVRISDMVSHRIFMRSKISSVTKLLNRINLRIAYIHVFFSILRILVTF